MSKSEEDGLLSSLSLSAVVTRQQARSHEVATSKALSELLKEPTRVSSSTNSPPTGIKLFEGPEIQKLWNRAVEKDSSFCEVYTSLERGDRLLPQSVGSSMQIIDCSFDDKHALVYRDALWVPNWEPLRTALIQKVHDSHMTGHPGREITLSILSRSFFWPQQYKDVRRFVRNCHVCGRSKVWRQSSRGLLRPLPIPEQFHSELAIDFMTDLPVTDKKEKFLMVIHDRLLGSATLEAMETIEAEACADKFILSHWRYHGLPNSLISDRGSN